MFNNNSKKVLCSLSCRSVALIANLCVANPGWSDALLDEPLALSERAPLTQRFNLPAMRSGELLDAGGVQWRFGVDVANNFVRNHESDEAIVFDGESQRYELGVRYGLGDHWEVGAMVPWIAHNGGVLDNFIETWHRFWGLPDANRPDYLTRQLHYRYQRDGRTELDFQRAESGVGDVQLQVANQLLQTSTDSLALIASVNLPTGDEADLTGAGGTSGGILVAATHLGWLDLPLTLSANVGVQTLPHGDVLDDRQKDRAWFGAGEIAWAVAPAWRLRAQVNMHSALYDSKLTALGSTSTQLLLGGSVRLSDRWVLDAAVGEDVAVDTAPDVTFQLAVKTRY